MIDAHPTSLRLFYLNMHRRYISVPELSVQACLVYSESPFESVATSSKVKDPMVSGLQECGFIAPVTARHGEAPKKKKEEEAM